MDLPRGGHVPDQGAPRVERRRLRARDPLRRPGQLPRDPAGQPRRLRVLQEPRELRNTLNSKTLSLTLYAKYTLIALKHMN